MADYHALQATIDAYIKQNGVQAITGPVLNGILTAMVNALGKGFTIAGEASPSTDPGTMTGPVAYIAHTAGTYTHFGNLVVNDGEVAMLIYDEQTWRKDVMASLAANASVDANVGTPSVNVSFVNDVLTFDFKNLKGEPGEDGINGHDGAPGLDGLDGQDGADAGFGTIDATVDNTVGTPGVTVVTSGPNTAKNMTFQFTNLKGQKGDTGVTSVVVTVDNNTGVPGCTASLSGGVLTLAFTNLKGAQGDTGVSADYPITIANNLTTNDPTNALSAAMGVQLESEITQLDLKVDEILPAFDISPNVLDVSKSTADTRFNAQTGASISDTSVDASDYIPVVEGDTYVYQRKNNGTTALESARWYFYDSAKTYITWSLVTSNTATIPSGAAYMRVSYSNATASSERMIHKGSSVTTYKDFYHIVKEDWIPSENGYDTSSDAPLKNKVIADTILNGNGYGKNSIPTKALVIAILGENKLDTTDADYMVDRNITATGTASGSGNVATGFIPAVPGQKFRRYSSDNASALDNFTNGSRWNAYDSNKSPISGAYYSSGVGDDYTVPEGASYVRSSFSNAKTYKMVVVNETRTQIPYVAPEYILDIKNLPLSKQNNDANFIALWKNTIALPSVKAFAGLPINIYYGNIVNYFKEDVYFSPKINKGELTKKKWAYTPNGAETLSVPLIFLDHSYRELNNDSIPVTVVASSVKSSLKVLVIGDSTVNLATSLPGGGETQKMLDLASADNYPLTLLGTRGVGLNQHEGRGGWTAKMYCTQASAGTTQNAFWNPNTSKFDFSYYMTQQGYSGVDCVFIQLGINDMTSYNGNYIINDETAESAINDFFTYMDEMIESIHTYDADINIVVNLTIPCTDNQDKSLNTRQPWWRHKRNTYLLNVASLTHYANMANVFVSWFNAAIDIDYLSDAVHPTQEGFDELGTQMYSFMRAIN